MRPLDANTIRDIKKAFEGADGLVSLYAVENENGVMLTNQQWLIEWPHDLVEPCPTLDALFNAPPQASVEKMREIDWRREFVASDDFLPWDELEPDEIFPQAVSYFTDFEWKDGELVDEFLTVQAVDLGDGRQAYYDHKLIAAIEAAFYADDPPEFALYEEAREGKAPLILMCVFYAGELVGLLCNCVIQKDTIVEDEETGKAAVVVRR